MKKCFAICCLVFLTLLVWSGGVIYQLKLELAMQKGDSQMDYLTNVLNVRTAGCRMAGLDQKDGEDWLSDREVYLYLLGMTAESAAAIPQTDMDSMETPNAQALLYGLTEETYGDLPWTAEGFGTDAESFSGRFVYQTMEILKDIPDEDTQSLKKFLSAIEQDERTEKTVKNLQEWREQQSW